MTVGTVVEHPFAAPVCNALSVHTEIPVLLPVGMALTANEICFVESKLLIAKCTQEITLLGLMTNQAPHPTGSVIYLVWFWVQRHQLAQVLQLGRLGLMALGAGKKRKGQFLLTGND